MVKKIQAKKKVVKKKKRKLKKDRMKSWQIFQGHHVSYPCCDKPVIGELDLCVNCKKTFNPEIIFRITRTEHFFAGRMERYFKYRGMTPGMAKTLKYYCKKFKGYKGNTGEG